MTSGSAIETPVRPPSTRRRRFAGRLAALVAVVLLAVGCSSGPGTKAEMIDVLSRDGAFTEGQATCIADAVFDRYGDDEEALGKISAADSFELFDTADGIPGFSEFFTDTVQGCAPTGPTTG
ncbi:MAG: hypothetical protein AAF547_05165 [Actinomycetota bacterium]